MSHFRRYAKQLEEEDDNELQRFEADVRDYDPNRARRKEARRVKHSEDEEEDAELRASKQRMNDGYEQMMRTYQRQQKQLAYKDPWTDPDQRGAIAPAALTVTHVNQTADLQRMSGARAANQEKQNTEEWLEYHGLQSLKLTLKDLVNKGEIQRPLENEEKKVRQRLRFSSIDVNEFEFNLTVAIENYTNRIKWLLQGSKRLFGLVQGERLAIVLDASDANCNFGRLTQFQDSLLHLIDEQLPAKQSLFLMSFGTDVYTLWKHSMDVNCRTLEEAKEWVSKMESYGGCNLLGALRQVLKLHDIDRILLVLGSVPDQEPDVISDHVSQLMMGRDLIIDTVSFDCNNQQANKVLKMLSEYSGGRYHCYSSAVEEQIYAGTDISLMLKEIQSAQNVLNKIREMREGLLGTALVTVMNEIQNEVKSLPPARFLPHPVGHDNPLTIQEPTFNPSTSSTWLKKHGLKAQGLDLYQVLSPNAYSFREEFVPVIRKTVQSQVHERSMAQFHWHDGSVKNVHVDMSQLFEYQKQLGATVKLYEKRIDWLTSASRRIFGSVAENRVVFLLDLSESNFKYLVHIQHSMRLMMEEQLLNKEYFNIFVFGDKCQQWQPTMRRPTPENLQAAWKWVLSLHCSGSRNFLNAFRQAVENEEERQHGVEVEGVYLFTSGVPDQSLESCTNYLEEVACGRDLHVHVILFNVDDYDANGAIPSRYANITRTAEILRSLAHCTDGRFHWFRETGIIESDDIAAISLEVEKSLNFSKKAASLVKTIKEKYNIDNGAYGPYDIIPDPHPALPYPPAQKALPPPKHTTLSETRVKAHHGDRIELSEENGVYPAGWRPSSAKKEDANSKKKDPMKRVKSAGGGRSQKAFFYTDSGNKNSSEYIGSVYDKFAHKKMTKKASVKLTELPKNEDQMTTKEWMRMYSLSKLKLDLDKLVVTLDCKHQGAVRSTHEHYIESKHCVVFPTINVKGRLKHLQMTRAEVRTYIDQLEQVLQRYLQRLQWLLSGSRRVFGTVVQRNVVVLIDTSGSMEPVMEELRKELASLVWEQIHKYCNKFNLIRFSRTCEKWKRQMVEPVEENCHDAIKWTSGLMANGNTCTLEALQLAFDEQEADAIYLLTDGKPDSSTALVLQEVQNMNQSRRIPIHTISYYCSDSTANNFLRQLASMTSGRFHCSSGDSGPQLFAHKMLTQGFAEPDDPPTPQLEGDDLHKLTTEIAMGRQFLKQARTFYDSYESLKAPKDDPHDCFKDLQTTANIKKTTKSRPPSGKRKT